MRLQALVRKEVLLLVRDPHALAVLFIMPALFLLLMAGAMSSYLQDRPPALRLVLDIPSASDSSQFFQAALQAQLPGSELLAESSEPLAHVRLKAEFAATMTEALAMSFARLASGCTSMEVWSTAASIAELNNSTISTNNTTDTNKAFSTPVLPK